VVSAHRRVKIDEDGTRNIFAIAGLSEEGLEGTRLADIFGIRIRTTVSLQTVLEKVSVR
jgi:hypothetical protein